MFDILKQLASRPLSLIGLLVVTLFLFIAIFGPMIAPYEYDTIIRGAARQAPSADHVFGTDRLGRDVFSRVLWGARDIIGLPTLATTISVFFGTVLGLALGYIGVLAVEMFHLGPAAPAGERMMVNEIAPRVHNSGHWTIEACTVSQFENHMRAVAGWPLGSAARHSNAEMTNLIGREALDWPRLAAEPGACLHLYGKHEARPGRKMGHVTRLSPIHGAA